MRPRRTFVGIVGHAPSETHQRKMLIWFEKTCFSSETNMVLKPETILILITFKKYKFIMNN